MRKKREQASFEPFIPLKEMPAADKPAELIKVATYESVPGYVYLLWGTAVGTLAVAYPTLEDAHKSRSLWVREFQPGIRCLVEVASRGFQAPDGPDVFDQAVDSNRRALWRYYARAIGQPAPYWPWNLERRELIAAWRPGNAVIVTVPQQAPLDMTPLLQLAALYPSASPAHRVLTHYYRRSAWNAAAGSRVALESFNDDVAFPKLANILTVAARAVDVPEPDDLDDLGEYAVRAVFAEIMDRRDTLAQRVVECIRSRGAERFFPFVTVERFATEHGGDKPCAMLSEWIRQLEEVPTYLPDPRFGYSRSIGEEADRVSRRLVDQATGAPVVEVLDFYGRVKEYVTLLPRRLPATTPLAELIIDCGGHSLWVRTEDGTLYPAPGGEYDVAWGYSGSYVAPLIERLLDDINTPPLDSPERPKDNGLTSLTKHDVPDGTVFTRQQLEEARRRPGQDVASGNKA